MRQPQIEGGEVTYCRLKSDVRADSAAAVQLCLSNGLLLADARGKQLTKTTDTHHFSSGAVATYYSYGGGNYNAIALTDDMIEPWLTFSVGDEVKSTGGATHYGVVVASFEHNNREYVVIEYWATKSIVTFAVDQNYWEKVPPQPPAVFEPGKIYRRLTGKGRNYFDVHWVKDGWAFGFGYNNPETKFRIGGYSAGMAIPINNNPNWVEKGSL